MVLPSVLQRYINLAFSARKDLTVLSVVRDLWYNEERGGSPVTAVGELRDADGVQRFHLNALESLGGVIAFFTGRRTGVSDRWQEGLNWSYSVGDRPENVRQNRKLSLSVPGLKEKTAVIAGLVHGNRVISVTGNEAPGRDEIRMVDDCDALITDRVGVALIVTAADCVPIFLYDPVRRAIGMVHAGWRGTVAGIASRTAIAMVETYGCSPSEIRAVIGPSIGPCCYEVDEVVAGPLRSHFGPVSGQLLRPGVTPEKEMLNLWEANRQDLHQAGIVDAQISGECTSCKVDQYFSHRAEAGTAGRAAGVIALV
jgi:YfiH family protein